MMDDVKPYRVKVKIQNNRLWRAILDKFPFVTNQTQAAQATGVSEQAIGKFLNMRSWPCRTARYSPSEGKLVPLIAPIWGRDAEMVATALCLPVEWLFDPVLYGRPANIVVLELDLPRHRAALEATGMLPLPEPADALAERHDLQRCLSDAMATLGDRFQAVMRMRFGLDGGTPMSLEEVAGVMEVTSERIRQMEAKALRLLRHPSRSKLIRRATDDGAGKAEQDAWRAHQAVLEADAWQRQLDAEAPSEVRDLVRLCRHEGRAACYTKITPS